MTSVQLIVPLFTLAATLAAGVTDPAPGMPSAAERELWVGRITDAHRAVADAERRVEAARSGYAKMKRHRKARGEKRAEIREERESAEAAVVEARQNLERILEEARRAGVPPGWVREAEEAAAEHPAALP